MHEVLVNRLGGLSLPRKSVVRLTDRPDMTLDVYRGRKTTMQQNNLYLPSRLFYLPDQSSPQFSTRPICILDSSPDSALPITNKNLCCKTLSVIPTPTTTSGRQQQLPVLSYRGAKKICNGYFHCIFFL